MLDASLWGNRIVAGGQTWETLTAHVAGPVRAPHFDAMLESGAGRVVKASASLDGVDASARAITLDLSQPGARLQGSIA